MTQTKSRVFVITLGCAKNQVDSEVMSSSLLKEGFSFVPDPAEADVILLNTCSFIRDAVQESLEYLDSLTHYKREGSCTCFVLAGCLVQRYGKVLQEKLPDVDLFIGMQAVEETGALLSRSLAGTLSSNFFLLPPSPIKGNGTFNPSQNREALAVWAYVKIAEGCSNRCSYCTLPEIRGPLKSREPEDIFQEVSNLAQKGVEEINLVAQDVAAYGLDNKGREKNAPLANLLRKLDRIQEVRWLRLLYCHPAHIDESIISLFGDLDKLCPYLDLPIQHVSERILKGMNRSYNRKSLKALINDLRSVRPDIALRTTLMVGFPGETEADFEQLLQFLEEVRFHHLGVFMYSPEEGTPAFDREETVSFEEKEFRFQEVMKLQAKISEEIHQTYLGTVQEVLMEGVHEENPELFKARTRFQAPEVDGVVIIPEGSDMPPGMTRVRIVDAHTYDLVGEICNK